MRPGTFRQQRYMELGAGNRIFYCCPRSPGIERWVWHWCGGRRIKRGLVCQLWKLDIYVLHSNILNYNKLSFQKAAYRIVAEHSSHIVFVRHAATAFTVREPQSPGQLRRRLISQVPYRCAILSPRRFQVYHDWITTTRQVHNFHPLGCLTHWHDRQLRQHARTTVNAVRRRATRVFPRHE